jgi:hypothetical protein
LDFSGLIEKRSKSSFEGVIKTSGTDIHKPHETPSGGILTTQKMETMQDILNAIKSGKYSLVTE